ncbi:MAG: hypothetical protein EON85_16400 [Brevundimonas sp.]|nr:MAG: hypothetical protein EON85_16400 [Brevundimonas sp.]
MSDAVSTPLSLLVFGGGWLGRAAAREALRRGGKAAATSRDPATRAALEAEGVTAIDPADEAALATAVAGASALLITAPPDAQGCPGLRGLIPAITLSGAWPDWIGYISSTAVYGDRAGGWAFEDDALNAATLEGARRVPSVSDAMRRFYRDSKRLSNAKAKAELGWRPKYPGWREGLEAMISRA